MQWNANICFLFFELLSFSPFALINRANQLPSPQNSGPWKGATCKWRRLEVERHIKIDVTFPNPSKSMPNFQKHKGQKGLQLELGVLMAPQTSGLTHLHPPHPPPPVVSSLGRFHVKAEPGDIGRMDLDLGGEIGRMDGNLLRSW